MWLQLEPKCIKGSDSGISLNSAINNKWSGLLGRERAAQVRPPSLWKAHSARELRVFYRSILPVWATLRGVCVKALHI